MASVTEKEHKRDFLKTKLMHGDYLMISKMIDMPRDMVRIYFFRANEQVLEAVEFLTSSREKMLEQWNLKKQQDESN